MKHFTGIETIEQAKKLYRELMLKNHPDTGGDEEIAKQIIVEFEEFLDGFMTSAFSEFKKSKGFEPKAKTGVFVDILKNIMKFNITIDVIGYWIYCFDSYEVKEELKAMGFWFSKKHKAWVFSGMKKVNIRTKHTLDTIINAYGIEHVRDREELTAITA